MVEQHTSDQSNAPITFRALLWPHRASLAFAFILSILGSASALLQPIMGGRVIAAVTDHTGLQFVVSVLIMLFVGHTLFETASRYVLELVGERIVRALRDTLIIHLLRLPMRELTRQRVGDLLSRVTTDCGLIKTTASSGSVNLVSGVVTIIGAVGFMLVIDPVLAFIILATMTIAVVSLASVMARIQSATSAAQENVGMVASDLERVLSDLRTVKSNQTEQVERARIGRSIGRAYFQGVRTARLSALANPAVQLAASGSFIAILLFGGARVAAGDASLASLVTILLFALYLVVPVGDVFESVVGIQKCRGALARVTAIFDLEQEDLPLGPAAERRSIGLRSSAPTTTPEAVADMEATLRFCDVTFGYNDTPIIRNASFQLPYGSHTALVGSSGVGKTTIFSLVCRLYEPDSGRIIVNGLDIGGEPLTRARSLISLVDQSAPVLEGSLRDNLTYGQSHSDEDKLMDVVRQVHLTELVERLPDGLASSVGEHGNRLSGGERQRVALGRALMARPRLLLVDEPTAMLDAQAESVLMRSFDEIKRNCTLFTITHRRSTMLQCDRVLHLSDGKLEFCETLDEIDSLIVA